MQDIRRVLQLAARRLLLVRLFDTWAWTFTAAIGLMIALIVVDRAFGFGLDRMSWRSMPVLAWSGLASIGLAVVGGAVWSVLTRPRELAVAREVDERAGLRESLSTALCVEREQDPWSKAVVESASDKAKRVVVRDAIPIEGPSAWRAPTVSVVALILTFFLMPPLDLMGKRAAEQAVEEARQEVRAAVADAQKAEQEIREIMQKAGLSDEDMPDPELEAAMAKPEKPEEIRKQAIRKLTNLNDQLAKKLESDEAKSLDALKDMLRRLTSPGQGELTEFSRQLSRGNFDKAKAELEALNKKLASGELSEAQREELAKQMQNLASQLEQLAQDQQALQQAMQQAGVSAEQAKQLAQNPQAMQQALANNPNLSEQQKQDLQQMAQAAQQAASQCQGMCDAMGQMASSASQGQQGGQQGSQAGMQAMSAQLSAMEQMSAEMQMTSDAMGQCQAQMQALGECNGSEGWGQCQGSGQGGFKTGSSMAQGQGSGGPGQGMGAGPESQESDFFFTKEKANVQTQQGAIIGSRYVFGEQIKGESRAEFGAAVEIAAEQAAEDMTTMNVDPQFRGAVKNYFGRLQEAVKAEQSSTVPASESSDG